MPRSEIEMDGRITALMRQRDTANNSIVDMAGKMAVMAAQMDAKDAEIKRLTEENEKLKADKAA